MSLVMTDISCDSFHQSFVPLGSRRLLMEESPDSGGITDKALLQIFGEAYKDCNRRLLKEANSRCRSAQDAEDAVHEAWLRALQSHDQYDRSRPLCPWVSRILLNVICDSFRGRKKNTLFVSIDSEETHPSQPMRQSRVECLDYDALCKDYDDCLCKLRSQERECWNQRQLGLTDPEIAERLEITVNAVRIAIHRAKADLKVCMKFWGPEGNGAES